MRLLLSPVVEVSAACKLICYQLLETVYCISARATRSDGGFVTAWKKCCMVQFSQECDENISSSL